jgi:uncharacterized membrane protein
MNVHTDPLVDDYLRRLDAAASALPAHQREELISEIRDHLQEALRREPASDEASVRNLLERLGPPEEIAAAAADPAPPGHLVAPVRETNGSAVASVQLAVLWLAGVGSLLALVFGYGPAGRSRTQQAARKAQAWLPPASSSAGSGSPSC